MRVETALLLDVLETYKQSLDFVFMGGVTPTGGANGMSSWLDIFQAIHSAEVSSVKLYYMKFPSRYIVGGCVDFPEAIRTKPELEATEEGIGASFIDSRQAKSMLEIVLRAYGRIA